MVILLSLLSLIAVILIINGVFVFLKHRKAIALRDIRYAKIEDYGYHDHYLIKATWRAFRKILLVLTITAIYFSIFIIFLQSVNASKLVSKWDGFSLTWYKNLFSNSSLNNAILHTFLVSIIVTIASTILGSLIAVGIFYSSPKVRKIILLINNFPLLNADIVTGISLMLIFSLFITFDPYFFGIRSLVISHLFFALPYTILNVLNKLKELDQNIVDAAFDLGIKPFKTLYKVILPNCLSGIFSGALLSFTMSFDDFVISYYTTGNGFDNLSIWIYSSIGRKSLSPQVYAFSVLMILACILVISIAYIITTRKKKHAK